jgi:hypothetical protein
LNVNNRGTMSRLLLGMLATLLASQAHAQRPDLSGIWVAAPGFHHGRGAFLSLELPFTEAGRAAWQGYDQADDDALRCAIDYGRITGSSVLPLEILQGEDVVHILYEYEHQVRRIHIEGRSEPPNQPPSYVGLSVGHWEGDTLVVEVTRLHAGSFFERGNGPYSNRATVTEIFRLADDGERLVVTRTIDDPLFYTEPFDWTTEYVPGGPILPYECEIREYLGND